MFAYFRPIWIHSGYVDVRPKAEPSTIDYKEEN